MKTCLSCLAFLFMCNVSAVQAQKAGNGTISGVSFGDDNAPVSFAVVLLKNKSDSLLFKGEQSDEQGRFLFEQVPPGSYFLLIQAAGVQTRVVDSIHITETNSTVDLGKITLHPQELDAVQIIADKPFIERQVDRTVINIENSLLQTGSSLLDMMEKLPMVQVSQEGNISVKGKAGVIVLLDGKQTGLSGQDLANMLRGMPSSNIQKVEIITNPSAKYDAAGNAGIINIITKKNRQQGFNGSTNMGYGQGRYEKCNGGIQLAYKNKGHNVFFGYGFSHRKGFNNLRLVRNFYYGDTLGLVFDTDNYILFPFNNHTPRLGADFTLSKNSSISILGTGVINHFNPSASNHTDLLDGNMVKTGSYQFTNQSEDKWYNYAFNTRFRHTFDTTGKELTADLDYARYWNNTDQRFSTVYLDQSGVYVAEDILLGDQDGELSIYSAKTDYSQPLGKKGRFEAGIKSSYVTTDNDMRFYNEISGESFFDSTRSNHFIYSENINAAYVNWNHEFNKLTVQFGLRTEHTHAQGLQVITNQSFDRNYIQLFPTVFFDYKLNAKHGFNLSAGKRIDRPMYQQMNPFRKLIDATTYAEGNPFLLPQISYNTELTYVFDQSLFITLGYSYTIDNITDVLIQDSQNQLTIQGLVNLESFNYYNVNVTYSKKLTKWWMTNTNVLWYYGIYAGTINAYSINQGTPSVFINTNNSFSINERWSAEAGYYYSHKQLYGVTLMNSTSNLSLGLQCSLFKKKASITVNVNDLMWKSYPSGDTHFGNVDENWVSKRDTRQVNLSFQYRFGKGPMNRGRRTSGADDEKKRTGV
ncbi:MAG: outer membrane beta-barrel protein [Flavobacteriales bacterium]